MALRNRPGLVRWLASLLLAGAGRTGKRVVRELGEFPSRSSPVRQLGSWRLYDLSCILEPDAHSFHFPCLVDSYSSHNISTIPYPRYPSHSPITRQEFHHHHREHPHPFTQPHQPKCLSNPPPPPASRTSSPSRGRWSSSPAPLAPRAWASRLHEDVPRWARTWPSHTPPARRAPRRTSRSLPRSTAPRSRPTSATSASTSSARTWCRRS